MVLRTRAGVGSRWFEWPWPAGGTVSRPFQSIPRVGDRAFRPGRDPVFSRSCSTLEEQRERAGDLFERTVVVKVLRGGSPSCVMTLLSPCQIISS